MSYFAKYLPVEGGNLIIKNTGGKEEKIIGRLFLCSRDIQVGDKFHVDYTISGYTPEQTCLNVDSDTVYSEGINDDIYSPKEKCWKVIGPISPQAIWVKEGDEFEKGEVIEGPRVTEDVEIKEGLITRTYWGDRVKVIDPKGFADRFLCEYLDEPELNHHPDCRKGETYRYSKNSLGYTTEHYYKIKCSTCKTFH